MLNIVVIRTGGKIDHKDYLPANKEKAAEAAFWIEFNLVLLRRQAQS
jgi:hypothetical protein